MRHWAAAVVSDVAPTVRISKWASGYTLKRFETPCWAVAWLSIGESRVGSMYVPVGEMASAIAEMSWAFQAAYQRFTASMIDMGGNLFLVGPPEMGSRDQCGLTRQKPSRAPAPFRRPTHGICEAR